MIIFRQKEFLKRGTRIIARSERLRRRLNLLNPTNYKKGWKENLKKEVKALKGDWTRANSKTKDNVLDVANAVKKVSTGNFKGAGEHVSKTLNRTPLARIGPVTPVVGATELAAVTGGHVGQFTPAGEIVAAVTDPVMKFGKKIFKAAKNTVHNTRNKLL